MPATALLFVVIVGLQAPAAEDPVVRTPAPTEDAREPDRPITHLFHNLVKDVARLPSVGTATILAGGTGGALVIRSKDDNLRGWVASRGKAGYTSLGRTIGDGWIQGGAALATFGIGFAMKRDEVAHVGSDLIRAQVLNAVITRASKIIVGRRRPGGSSDSFPSGHTSASFATAAVLGGHYGWEVAVPAYAVAAFVGWTRVRDDAHWATDVVAGATAGMVAGYTVTRGHRPREWVVLPTAGPRSAAIMIVRIPRRMPLGR